MASLAMRVSLCESVRKIPAQPLALLQIENRAGEFAARNVWRKSVIVRMWRAIAANQEVVDTYAAHLKRNTFREMMALEGHVGASLSVKPLGGQFELLVMSYWESYEAIRRFSGDKVSDLHDAVVKPSTQKLLSSYDPKVEYFEILVATGATVESAAEPQPRQMDVDGHSTTT